MSKTFLVDIDETVLSYSDSFQFWMESNGNISHRRLRDKYEIAPTFGVSVDEIPALLDEFSRTPSFAGLRAEPDALVVVSDLHRRGWTFVAISAAAAELSTIRAENLRLEFGFEWHVECIGTWGSKLEALSRYEPTWWVDDHPHHAVTGADVGHRTFLIDREHNRHLVDERVRRVPDWFAIREAVLTT
jgi:FMN phosphatase YigB (HAD superfamily)